MEFKDYYQTLGLKRNAHKADIKRAFRKLARKYHPDLNKEEGAEARFKEVNEAYEVLKDSEKRAAYDQLGENWQAGQQFKPPPNWDTGFEFSGGAYDSSAYGQQGFSSRDFTSRGDENFSDFFESLFGHTFRPDSEANRDRRQTKGRDHHAKILIDLEDSIKGLSKILTLKVPKYNDDGYLENVQHTLKVKIPQGVTAGQHIRLSGQADPGVAGIAAGDLYLEIEFRPHRLYRVRGNNLAYDLPITPWEAALGAKITIPTPKGPVDLTIPENSKNDQQLKLSGRGIPGKTKGDLFVNLKIVLPQANTEQAQAIYRDMANQLAFNPRKHLSAYQ